MYIQRPLLLLVSIFVISNTTFTHSTPSLLKTAQEANQAKTAHFKRQYENIINQSGMTRAEIINNLEEGIENFKRVLHECKTTGQLSDNTKNAIIKEALKNNPELKAEQLTEIVEVLSQNMCKNVENEEVMAILQNNCEFLAYIKTH